MPWKKVKCNLNYKDKCPGIIYKKDFADFLKKYKCRAPKGRKEVGSTGVCTTCANAERSGVWNANRHTVMRTLDRDHHGPFPVSPTAQKTASARLGAGPTVPAPSFAALGGGDDEEGSGDLPSIPTTPLGNSSILNVIEEKRTADELVSTLSRRIQELEGKNRSLEAELKRALGRNTVLEDMLKKTLEPVGDELDEDNGGGSE